MVDLLIGFGKPKGMSSESESESESEDYSERKAAAAQELLDAIKASDAEALAEAFEALMHTCQLEE